MGEAYVGGFCPARLQTLMHIAYSLHMHIMYTVQAMHLPKLIAQPKLSNLGDVHCK